jgi:hypothetical protein
MIYVNELADVVIFENVVTPNFSKNPLRFEINPFTEKREPVTSEIPEFNVENNS